MMLRVAFQIRFRYVSNLMNGLSFEPILDHFGCVCPGCVPDSVSLRFEFSFMNGSSFEPILGSFWRVCCVVAFQIRFCYVSNSVS